MSLESWQKKAQKLESKLDKLKGKSDSWGDAARNEFSARRPELDQCIAGFKTRLTGLETADKQTLKANNDQLKVEYESLDATYDELAERVKSLKS